MSGNAKQWRWVGEDGVEKSVSEQELIADLSSEALPNYTLVWRRGWQEWLPAMQVAELNWTLPAGKAGEAVQPKEKEGQHSPPAPPLYRYPVIKRRAANLKSREPPGASGKRTSAQQSHAGAQTARPSGIPLPEPATRGTAQPLAAPSPQDQGTAAPAESSPSSSNPAAVPQSAPVPASEPALLADSELISAPAAGLAAEHEPQDVDATFEESGPSNPTPAMQFEPWVGAHPAYSEDLDDSETQVMAKSPSAPPPPNAQYVPPHSPPPSEAPRESDDDWDSLPIPPPPRRPRGLSEFVPRARVASRSATRAYLVGGAIVVVAVTLIAIVSSRSTEGPSQVASAPAEDGIGTAPSTASVTPQVQTLLGQRDTECALNSAATLLADSAWVGVQPALAQVPGLERVAIGYAQSRNDAAGITIDPVTLDKDQVYRQHLAGEGLVTVTPATTADALKFRLTRDDPEFQSAAVVNATRAYLLGRTRAGLARRFSDASAVDLIWPLDGGPISVPRVAELPGLGHAVALRSGGKQGLVRIGWLSESGGKRTELYTVPGSGRLFGTPSVAGNGKRGLVSFAATDASDTVWSLHLSIAEHDGPPGIAKPFRLPKGGPGANAISPVAIGLPDGRWLLQWTEGASGNRRVRAQALNSTLDPISDAIELSSDAHNAGQGALWARGDTIVSLFLVGRGEGHELWGASLECKRRQRQTDRQEDRR